MLSVIHVPVYRSADSYSIALSIPRELPLESLRSRWLAEPIQFLLLQSSTFSKNEKGHPILAKDHQNLLIRYMGLKRSPWPVIWDSDPAAFPQTPQPIAPTAGVLSLQATGKETTLPSLFTTAEALQGGGKTGTIAVKLTSFYVFYLRLFQRLQPPRTSLAIYGSEYRDLLQPPMRPLTDNLVSNLYEAIEEDPVKYDMYEHAIFHTLIDWTKEQRPTSSTTNKVVVAIVGAGRGPLVTRALRASAKSQVEIEIWAVEKNPHTLVILQNLNRTLWGGLVNIVQNDMRGWRGPSDPSPARMSTSNSECHSSLAGPTYRKVDILISELLGSFADNELSPECLDGVQHVLAVPDGVSIPSSYSSHITPVLAPALHGQVLRRALTDPAAFETSYVVMLHAIEYLAISSSGQPVIQEAWKFTHPLPASVVATTEERRSGRIKGNAGANSHNSRHTRLKFHCKHRGVLHGIAGYLEAVLYDGGLHQPRVELSTRPDTIDSKSPDLLSWFPIYFPLKVSRWPKNEICSIN